MTLRPLKGRSPWNISVGSCPSRRRAVGSAAPAHVSGPSSRPLDRGRTVVGPASRVQLPGPSASARTTASGTTRTNDNAADGRERPLTSHAERVRDAGRRPPREWLRQPRFEGIVRLHSAARGRGPAGHHPPDYTVARTAAEAFYARLRELFAEGRQITTFGPYSPGQAVAMKRMGIEGIYLGGWATSAKGSRDRGPRARPRELPAQPGARRGGRPGPRAPHRRQEPALRPRAHDRGAAPGDAGGGLPAVHHRRRRHRPRRRRARAQPDPPLRRGRACPATTSRTRSRA